MRFERDDAKIGLLVLIAAGLFLALLLHRSLTAAVKKEAVVHVRLSNVSGLDIGSEVQLQGRRVGQVNEIVLQREGVEHYYLATLGLRPDIVLWKGTVAVVSSNGLSSAYLDLGLPAPKERTTPLSPDDVLASEAGASLGTLITEFQNFVHDLDTTLGELKAHLKAKGLGDLLDHPQVRRVLQDLDGTLVQFQKVAVRGDDLLKQGQGSVETLDRTLASLEKSSAMVEALLNKRSGDLDGIVGDLASLLKELNGLSADMQKLVKDGSPGVEESLRSLRRNLQATEELLEILKNKPSRVVWGTPSAAEKENARRRVEANRQKEAAPAP
jgi:ABC-type transporter Mla subunit MlaD